MASVISATTGVVQGRGRGGSASQKFLAAAEALLASAKEEIVQGRHDIALESSYRAALRVAGAVNAESAKIKHRKRLPSSAWDRLALTGTRGQEWAAQFSQYSRLRGRVASGIEDSVDASDVVRLFRLAESFFAEVYYGGDGPENDIVVAA